MPRRFFFDKTEAVGKRKKTVRPERSLGCQSCTLSKKCISPRMPPYGQGRLNIVVVGEAPGKNEDEQNRPFAPDAPAGKFLRRSLSKQGVDLDRDCTTINVIQCRPSANRSPTAQELLACRLRVDEQLAEIKPELIFAFGTPAISEILRDCPISPGATNMHGRVVPSVRWGCWVCCGFHPSWFVREGGKHDRRMDECIRAGLGKLAEGPYVDQRLDESQYQIVEDANEVAELFDRLAAEKRRVAFDYETTCLSPFDKNARILLAGFAVEETMGYCIPLRHPGARWTLTELEGVEHGLKRWLQSPCPKVIQNWQFEEIWSIIKSDIPVNNVVCCTMVRQHVIDNRTGITGQNFQEFVRYGSTHKQDVNPADLEHTPLDVVARYNTLDCRYLLKIHADQEEEMDDDLERAYQLFHEAIPVFTQMKIRGIPVDKDKLDAMSSEVADELARLDVDCNTDCMRKFRKRYGKEWDAGSNQAQKRMFYGVLGMEPLKLTEKGKDNSNPEHCSTDAESLSHLLKQAEKDSVEERLIQNCTELAGLVKLSGYIKGYRRLVDDEYVLHPSYLLHVPTSYRSSSADPNFQNIPIRKPKLARLRSCLVPRNDWLMEIDFSGCEVRAYAANSLDPVLLDHIRKGRDYHRHYAALLYGIPEEEITKQQRQKGKDGFIFPELYGDYYKQIAEANPQWSEKRIQQVEKILRQDLKVLWKWKDEDAEFYYENGYVAYPTGFKARFGREGLLTFNQLNNMPNQGSAFHRLLRVLLDIEKEMRRRELRSWILGQIHDSIVGDVFNDEIDEIVDLSARIVCEPCWQWDSVVPWEADYKIGKDLLIMHEI